MSIDRIARVGDAQTSSRGSRWVTPLLLALCFLIVASCLVLAPRTGAEGEAFGGTDAAATQTLEEQGVSPWFEPLFEPGSTEVESGLFALQAALGAGVFGYALGNLRGRRTARAERPSEVDVPPEP